MITKRYHPAGLIFFALSLVHCSLLAQIDNDSLLSRIRGKFKVPDRDLTGGFGQDLVGYWNFESGYESVAGGAFEFLDGSKGATSQKAAIKLASEFGLKKPGADDQSVLHVPKCEPGMGFKAKLKAHPAGIVGAVNEFTLAFQVYFQNSVSGTWRALLETTSPHLADFYSNPERDVFYATDADFFINESDGVGILGNYIGLISPEQWTWIVIKVRNTDSECRMDTYIDGDFVGSYEIQTASLDYRWSLPFGAHRYIQFFSDDTSETNEMFVNQIAIYSGQLTDQDIRSLNDEGNPDSVLKKAN